jgi:ribose transport system ATP-binding protein
MDPNPMTMQPLLVASELDKTYPPATVALDHASITLRPGEIHGLLGANGAGKSTLIKILAGVERPDAGTIWIADRGNVQFKSPTEAHAAGIGVVHQELPLFAPLTAAENVALGTQSGRPVDAAGRAENNRRYLSLTRSLVGAPDPETRLEDVGIDAWQLVAIARALASSARVLILDEPTSSLDRDERGSLHQTLRRLRADGLAILYVSHFLDDVLQVSDSVTIMRDGRVALQVTNQGLSPERLLEVMIGPSGADVPDGSSLKSHPASSGAPILALKGLAADGVGPIDLSVATGECVGLWGLQGCGARELLHAAFGLSRASGSVLLDGAPLKRGANARVRRGLAFLPPERTGSLVLDWSVAENLSLPAVGRRPFLGRVDRHAERVAAETFVSDFGLVGDISQPVRSLSGGNQQRVALGKWLIGPVRCLLADEPTRGVDVRGRAAIHDVLLGLLQAGSGLLVYSTDPEELVHLSQRVLILDRGRIRAELIGSAVSVASLESASRVRDSTPSLGAIQ